MKTSRLRACAALVVLAGAASIANAQVITNSELHRGLYYPNTVAAYDGEPTTQRYSYNAGAIAYINGSAAKLYEMDYRDKLERALKFGHPLPQPPEWTPHHLTLRERMRLGHWRWR